MHFNCTFCGGKIEGEEAWVGLASECPYCKMEITIPAPEAIQLPPVPPPKDEESVEGMPPPLPVSRQHAPLGIGAVATKGVDLARKSLTSLNKGLDDFFDKLAIQSATEAQLMRESNALADKMPISSNYDISLYQKIKASWPHVAVALVPLLVICFGLLFSDTHTKTTNGGKSWFSNPFTSVKSSGKGKQKATQGAYDLYMKGYNNPEMAEIAQTVGFSNEEERKCVMMVILGADDRKSGLPVRFELVE